MISLVLLYCWKVLKTWSTGSTDVQRRWQAMSEQCASPYHGQIGDIDSWEICSYTHILIHISIHLIHIYIYMADKGSLVTISVDSLLWLNAEATINCHPNEFLKFVRENITSLFVKIHIFNHIYFCLMNLQAKIVSSYTFTTLCCCRISHGLNASFFSGYLCAFWWIQIHYACAKPMDKENTGGRNHWNHIWGSLKIRYPKNHWFIMNFLGPSSPFRQIQNNIVATLVYSTDPI